MGMYTGLSFIGIVKDDMIDELNNILYDDFSGRRVWENATTPKLKEFGDTVRRQSFIPYGSLAYMPSEWDKYHGSTVKDKLWNFTCSLKNYEDEIGIFLRDVAPVVADTYVAIVHYEEWDDDYHELYSEEGYIGGVHYDIDVFQAAAESMILTNRLDMIEALNESE